MFKNLNWGLIIVLFAVAIAGGVISQLITRESVNDEGEQVRKLSIGKSKKDDAVKPV